MANLIEGLWAKASPFDATKRIVRPDGETRYIRCVGVPLVDGQVELREALFQILPVTYDDWVERPG